MSYSYAQTLVLESGDVVITHLTTTVTFNNTFVNPVVIAIPPTFNGSDDATVKVDNITSTSFDLRIEEPSNLDGTHINETVHYIVVETGSFTFPGGTIIEAGTVSSNDLSFQTVNLTGAFPETPIIFTQVQTNNSSTNFIKTRQRNPSNVSFDAKLERAENINSVPPTDFETIGYVAVTSGVGIVDGVQIEAGGFTGNSSNTPHNFSVAFNAGNHVVTSIGTFNGGNPAGIRLNSLTATNLNVFIEEDTTNDSEVWHVDETINYFVLNGGADQGVFLPILLPVELLEFDAIVTTKRSVLLNWTTLSEYENDYFEIRRSTDLENWEFVASVDGFGNGSELTTYTAEDLNPVLGLSYYKLIQVDIDGVSSDEGTRSVVLSPEQNGELVIYPNPSSSIVKITGPKSELESMKVIDVQGHEIKLEYISTGEQNVTIDISMLDSGIYLLHTTNAIYKIVRD